MKTFGQARSVRAATASASRPSGDQPPAWDWRTWLVAIPMALIVCYAFFPILDNDFVGWDDDQNFIDNPYFRGLGAAQIKWAWTTSLMGVYQPLAWMIYEGQFVLFQLHPRGYHLTSLLFQVANAVALYVLTVALLVRCRTDTRGESRWACLLSVGFATVLFAVHPLRVEPVAWLSAQMYLPCILFSVLSVLAYLQAFWTHPTPRWGWLVGSYFLFVAALLCHAVPVNLPAVLLILDIYPLRRFGDGPRRWFGASALRILVEKVPFAMTSLLFMGIAIAVREQAPFRRGNYNVVQGMAQACYGIWFYIFKTVLPLSFGPLYPLPKEIHWLAFPYNLSILATLAMSAGFFLVRRRWPGLLAVWLSYLLMLAPNSGIVRNNNFTITADRYSYMSMLGLVALAAACFTELWRMSTRRRAGVTPGIITLGLGVLLALIMLTRNQCLTWHDSGTLWAHALRHGASTSDLAHNNWGATLHMRGKYQAAEEQFAEALRLNPSYTDAHYNMATVLSSLRRYAESETHFAEALRLNPHHIGAHNNLGNVLLSQGHYEAAATHFNEALRLNPGYADARNNLGNVFSSEGKLEAAVAQYTEALRLNPHYADAHYNLGIALQARGNDQGAEGHFAEAVRLNPGYAEAHSKLGALLYNQGKYEDAAAYCAEAIRLNPNDDQSHNNQGKILSRRGKYEEAAAHFTEAVRLNPSNSDAHNNLGVALEVTGRYQEAMTHFGEALQLNPNYGDAHYNLGNILLAYKKYDEAAAHFIDALRLNPGYAGAHISLGTILSHQKKYAEAKAHFAEAVRLHPDNAQAHDNLGLVFSRMENYEAARAQFAEAIRLQPDDPNAYNASAMLMAACPDAKFRDGKRAVRMATRACELTKWKNPIILDTLAAAQAEVGDFEAAVKSQKNAIELLTVERQKDEYRTRLALYQAKKPYRQVTPRHASSEARR